MSKQPLNLPEGSVRAILALLIVVATLVGLLFFKLPPDAVTALTVLSATVTGYYFGARKNGKTNGVK